MRLSVPAAAPALLAALRNAGALPKTVNSSSPQNHQPIPHPSPRSRPSALALAALRARSSGQLAAPRPLPGGAWI